MADDFTINLSTKVKSEITAQIKNLPGDDQFLEDFTTSVCDKLMQSDNFINNIDDMVADKVKKALKNNGVSTSTKGKSKSTVPADDDKKNKKRKTDSSEDEEEEDNDNDDDDDFYGDLEESERNITASGLLKRWKQHVREKNGFKKADNLNRKALLTKAKSAQRAVNGLTRCVKVVNRTRAKDEVRQEAAAKFKQWLVNTFTLTTAEIDKIWKDVKLAKD